MKSSNPPFKFGLVELVEDKGIVRVEFVVVVLVAALGYALVELVTTVVLVEVLGYVIVELVAVELAVSKTLR